MIRHYTNNFNKIIIEIIYLFFFLVDKLLSIAFNFSISREKSKVFTIPLDLSKDNNISVRKPPAHRESGNQTGYSVLTHKKVQPIVS